MTRCLTAALIAFTLAGCQTTANRTVRLAEAKLANAAGQEIGTAAISSLGNEIRISLTVTGTPGSVHGLHLHAVGKCEAPFSSAGPHLNPAGHQHGRDNPQGAHLGDLPNITIGQSGTGTASASLGTDSAAISTALFDADGTAIVLHAAADDYRTDPSGNSGARIACGVLTRP